MKIGEVTEGWCSEQRLLCICPGMSDSLQPHGLRHTRPPCPSLSPGVCPSSCSLHQWCHPAISSSETLFSFCPWCLPASGTFPMSRLFASDDQNTGASASASVLPVNIQCWFPLRLTGLISLLARGLSGVFQHHSLKASILWHSEQWYPYPKSLSNSLPSKSLNPLPSKMVTVGLSLIFHSNLLAENWKI